MGRLDGPTPPRRAAVCGEGSYETCPRNGTLPFLLLVVWLFVGALAQSLDCSKQERENAGVSARNSELQTSSAFLQQVSRSNTKVPV